MTSSLFVATAVVDRLVTGLRCLIGVLEAYLDARFLTMIAVLEREQNGQ